MRLVVAVVSFFLLCALEASAEDFVEQSTRIRFPEAISVVKNAPAPATCTPASPALCRGQVARYPDPKLGIGLTYSHGVNLVTASVFIYDYGESGFPDGAQSRTVETHFENMKREIGRMESAGDYRNIQLLSEDAADSLPSIGALKARAARFSFERDGRKYLSDAYLSALNGKLLKIRVTYRADVTSARAASDAFMAELGARVSEAVIKRSMVNMEIQSAVSAATRRRS